MSKFFKLLMVFAGLALVAMPVQAYETGDWIFRGGIGMVDPDDPAYSDEDGSFIIDEGVAVTLNATYMFTPNWGFDILASTPFSHDVNLSSEGISAEIGEVKHLPPTFSLQYHFAPDNTFQPYAGLGLNMTLFFDEELNQSLLPGFDLDVDESFGLAVQLGADVKINEKWLVNFDIRYISIEPDATLSGGGESDTVELEINPLVYSINVGFIF